MKALVLAAGEGSRLRPYTLDRPKPMVDIAGEPALAHELRWLAAHGVGDVAINLHHCPGVLRAFVGDGAAFGVRVTYSMEPDVLGTSGALGPLRGFFAGERRFAVLYGDVLTDLALDDVVTEHDRAGADATIVLTRVEDPTRAGIVGFDGDRWITRMVEKPAADAVFSDWANAGVYVCGPAVLGYAPERGAQDFVRDLFPAMLRDGRRLRAHPTNATVIDFGAPDRLAEAAEWVGARRSC